jgi:hypothetical protein
MKSQITLEFVTYFTVAIFIVILISTALVYHQEILSEQQELENLERLAQHVKNEFITAANTEDGYSREITLPERLQGEIYTITSIQTVVYVTQGELETTLRLPTFTGTITKNMTLRKQDGELLVS